MHYASEHAGEQEDTHRRKKCYGELMHNFFCSLLQEKRDGKEIGSFTKTPDLNARALLRNVGAQERVFTYKAQFLETNLTFHAVSTNQRGGQNDRGGNCFLWS
jgi:hypothetical protein